MKRVLLMITVMIIILTITVTVFGAELGQFSSIGVIKPDKIMAEAERFKTLKREITDLEKELEEFKALVYEEHSQKIRELTKENTERAAGKSQEEQERLYKELEKSIQELAAKTQERIDNRLRELQALRLQKEDAAQEELLSIVKKVAKSRKVSIILYEPLTTAGGRDLTDEVLKKWHRMYHPTWWDRFLQIFKKKE